MAKVSPVKSAMRTLDIIEYVVAHRSGAITQEIAGALGIPLSSLSYLLATLVDRGYLLREGRRFMPGPGLDRLRVSEASLPLEERVRPLVRALRIELNETASFMVRDGWKAKILVTEAAEQALRYAIEPGERKPLHTLAAGKAILASLSDEELAAYFVAAVPLESSTPNTIVDEAVLRKQLVDVRKSGLAVAVEESTPGICSIGVAVSLGGKTVGSIGIAVPSIRFTEEVRRHAGELLRRTATALA